MTTPNNSVELAAAVVNGCNVFRSIDLDATKQQVKSTTGHVYSIFAMNMTTAPVYLKIWFLKSASVTVGTTSPNLTIPLPTLGNTNGAGVVWDNVYGMTIPTSTGITCACTTGIADNDTTGPATNGCIVNIAYK